MGCCSSNGILIDEIKKNDRSHQKNSSKINQIAIKITSNEDNLHKDKILLKEHNTTKEEENENKEKNKINNINI